MNEEDFYQSYKEIIDNALRLSRKLYMKMGYHVSEGFKFYESQHPTEIMVWEVVSMMYDELQGTELDCILSEYLEDMAAKQN